METREYFEKVMQDYNQNRNGRSLRKYCKDEAVDYNWLMEFKKTYSASKPVTHHMNVRWYKYKDVPLPPFKLLQYGDKGIFRESDAGL